MPPKPFTPLLCLGFLLAWGIGFAVQGMGSEVTDTGSLEVVFDRLVVDLELFENVNMGQITGVAEV